ncbi:MAG: type II secretion system F family protein [Clostridiales bacterium]|nr:type II secretion system F family protein [Clostridiales bacterium]
MAKYKYTAKDLDGTVISGVYQATTRNDVIRMLRQNNYYPLKIEKVLQVKDIRDFSFRTKIDSKDISVFCKQFATMLKAGIPIVQCLEVLSKQMSNHVLARLLADIHMEVHTGTSLSNAFQKRSTNFPLLFTSMIETGEASGSLDVVMENLAQHYEKEHKLKQKIKTAMTYPTMVLLVALGVIYFLLTTVVPTFIGIFTRSDMQLPLPTQLLLSLSSFLSKNGILILMFLFLAALTFLIIISREKGRCKWHGFLLRLPVIKKLIIMTVSARFAGTLGILLGAGIPLVQSLDIVTRVVGNEVFREGLQQVQEMTRIGSGISLPLERLNLFPPMLIQMLKVGEETGAIDEMLLKAAEFYESEVENSLIRLTTLLEPAVIVLLGGLIAFVVLSIAMPMFEMMNIVNW